MLKTMPLALRKYAGRLPAIATDIARRLRPRRDPTPVAIIDPSLPYGIAIDRALRVNDREVCVVGWIFDAGGRIDHVEVRDESGQRIDLISLAHRLPRPDVDAVYRAAWPTAVPGDHGFLAFVPSDAKGDKLSVEMLLCSGQSRKLRPFSVQTNQEDAKSLTIEAMVAANRPGRETLLSELGSAMGAMHEHVSFDQSIVNIDSFGNIPTDPSVSIVVPQYARLDFLEPQLAAMASDASLTNCEIIHVIDSPKNHDDFVRAFSQLCRLFQVGCRVVQLEKNLGFAGATNVGAHVASGGLLLLLNSDVIPKRRGWMEALTSFYSAHDDIGALGCKLLYENDTIQHAGMAYRQEAAPPHHWLVHHPLKGLHENTPAALHDRPVPAITGACLMIDRETYWNAGGLSSDYLLGDFEDSDLCLRLLEAGKQNWYTAGATLYHLEGQSYAFDARRAAITRHNAIIHQRRWTHVISGLAAHPLPPLPTQLCTD
jgi:GT2 family glycosyltransferase